MLRIEGVDSLSDESRHVVSAIAARTVEVGNLAELGLLSRAATSADAAGFLLLLVPFLQKRSYDKAPCCSGRLSCYRHSKLTPCKNLSVQERSTCYLVDRAISSPYLHCLAMRKTLTLLFCYGNKLLTYSVFPSSTSS